ncbi:MAG: alkaline phosphatase [Mediterranea sp.]|nr:alkaline phosphatase [Mediterranea sp.]
MKRFAYTLFFILLAVTLHAQQAKYVFYFIGDGMGLNQVNATEMFLAEQENGRIGTSPLCFASFPYAGYATTYSATNSITDSSAAGTALATGVKTYNGAIGVNPDKEVVESVAVKAQRSGKRVGVTTSVSIDHATPSAFYAHQESRSWYYEIALDLPKAGFDFYAGSGFLKPDRTHDKKKAPSIYPIFAEAGYTLARGVEEYQAKRAEADKMILIQQEGADQSSLPYAIDRKEGDLTLKQITESAVDFLMKDGGKKGFFLMVEGGKIDWSCHGNDAATTVREVMDMDEAVKVAYEFYKKHPKETLIVVTADHETGGLGLGYSKYELHLANLIHQQESADALSRSITNLRRQRRIYTWEDIKEFLGEKMGFWKSVKINWEQEKRLRDAFEDSFVKNNVKFEESLYSKTEPLAAVAKQVMSQVALLGWTTSNHSAGYVPVYAVGAGAKAFSGKMDNTDIPKRIAQAAGYK